jgi:hypothetical protein
MSDWAAGKSGRFCPEFRFQCQPDFEAKAVTPLFLGVEIRTSIVVVIMLVIIVAMPA